MSQRSIYINPSGKRCNCCGEPLKFLNWNEDKGFCQYTDCSYSFSNFRNAINKALQSEDILIKQTAQWAKDNVEAYLNAPLDKKHLYTTPKQTKFIFHKVTQKKQKLFIKKYMNQKKQTKILKELGLLLQEIES